MMDDMFPHIESDVERRSRERQEEFSQARNTPVKHEVSLPLKDLKISHLRGVLLWLDTKENVTISTRTDDTPSDLYFSSVEDKDSTLVFTWMSESL